MRIKHPQRWYIHTHIYIYVERERDIHIIHTYKVINDYNSNLSMLKFSYNTKVNYASQSQLINLIFSLHSLAIHDNNDNVSR